MIRTFIDTGVLIAAARGTGEVAQRAFAVLDDPTRVFASRNFVKLEVLPMPTYHRRADELAFLHAFFEGVGHWPESDEAVISRAFHEASQAGLAAVDAIHVAAASLLHADQLVTTEKRRRALHRTSSIPVHTI